MPKLSVLEGYINTALNGITGIKHVYTDIGLFNKTSTYPALYYSINRGGSKYIKYFTIDSTSTDKEGIAEVKIYGTVNPTISKNIKRDTYALISDAEKAINSSVNLQGNIVSCHVTTEENDMDINDSFGHYEMTVEIVYLYNHLSP